MRYFLALGIAFLLFSFSVYAGPGDTTLVKTLEFSDITKRRGWYSFPSDTMHWEKILMYYTLKCDAATTHDGYPCGEWDYTTYTHLYEYNNLNFPYYTNNGIVHDSILLSYSPTFTLMQNYQYNIVYDDTISEDHYLIGNGTEILNHTLKGSLMNNRAQYLWTEAELVSAGLDSGDVHRVRLDMNALGDDLNHLKVRMKNTNLTELSNNEFENSGFTEVYNQNTSFAVIDTVDLDFTKTFVWDGTSNIVVDFSYSNTSTGTDNVVYGEITGFNSGIVSTKDDGYLSFFKPDYIEVPNTVFSTVDSFITVSFWQLGDTALLPQNSYMFEGKDTNGYRVINSHLPWSNSNVYWDAGNSETSSYDRIYQSANTEDFEGKWNHWAFTKNVSTGEMKIFLNGNTWSSGTGKTKTMGGISNFRIAAPGNNNGRWDGYISDFRIWDIDLDSAVINDWLYKDIDVTHPYYSNLRAWYKFDDITGNKAMDASSYGSDAQLMGLPDMEILNGQDHFRNMMVTSERPNISFVRGQYNSHIDSILVVDTVINSQISIVESQPYRDVSVSGMSFDILDTLYGWHAGYSYTYDPYGLVVDSNYIVPDTIFYNHYEAITHQIQNFVTPYGINLDLGPDGFTWIYDVTDYGPWLNDTIEFSAGNQQELIDVTFVMIEGTPPRDVLSARTIWRGDYGHASIADDVSMPAVDVQLDPNASMFLVRTRTTGHGMGSLLNCAEFCPKTHNLKINGVQEFQWLNWTECAMNPVYPQGGTWIYDRAGWCPGSFGDSYNWEITDLVNPGDIVSIDYGMEAYQSGGGQGNYRTTVQLFEYSAPNFILDAAVSDIIAPNNWEYYDRFNPICDSPEIEIKNTGSTELTSLQIDYGYEGSLDYSYTWTGSLNFLETEKVKLPPVSWAYFQNDSIRFEVSISAPNGGVDEYLYNNKFYTWYEPTPVHYTEGVVIAFRTNKMGHENYYELYDADGNVVFNKSGLDNETLYIDSIMLSEGCYTLTLYDSDDDGISFWANAQTDGSGYIRMKIIGGYTYSFATDFGKRMDYRFAIADNTSISEYYKDGLLSVYPNPTEGLLNINIRTPKPEKINVLISDMFGKIVFSEIVQETAYEHLMIDMTQYSAGVYFVNVKSGSINKTEKVIIN